MIFAISTLALILSLVGNIYVNYQKRIGFVIWTLSNVVWIIVNFMSVLNIPQVVMYLVYMCLNIHGFIIWSKKESK